MPGSATTSSLAARGGVRRLSTGDRSTGRPARRAVVGVGEPALFLGRVLAVQRAVALGEAPPVSRRRLRPVELRSESLGTAHRG